MIPHTRTSNKIFLFISNYGLIFFSKDIFYQVAEDKVIQSYFYQIDQGALPEVRIYI